METPAFVRSRGQASGEEVFFFLAQAANAPELCQHPGDFFFHGPTLPPGDRVVEGENASVRLKGAGTQLRGRLQATPISAPS